MENLFESYFAPTILLIIALGVIASIISRHRRMKELRSKNYHWYITTYPASVQGNSLRCFKCSGNRIHVRGLMGRTFHREHFCTKCGTTLYYSPEG
jgi:hypothetical protein